MKALIAVPIAAVLLMLASCSKQAMPVPADYNTQSIGQYSSAKEITDTLADKKAIPPRKVPIPKKGR
jgi:nitrous oxide reductase accessory protein NosL